MIILENKFLEIEESLKKESTYEIKGKKFVVRPLFKEDGTETLGTILLRLMTTKSATP